MKILTVTISGADDNTSLSELVHAAIDYPQIELGLLLSAEKMGENRYPSFDFLKKVSTQTDIPLSGHICQKWLIDMLTRGGVTLVRDLGTARMMHVWDRISRIQLNFYDYLTNPAKLSMHHDEIAANLMYALKQSCFDGKEFIFPHSDKSAAFIQKYMLPEFPDATILYDNSMEKGQAQATWLPPYPGRKNIYAGGLDPETLETTLALIAETVGDGIIGIDAETHLRTENELDIVKVYKMLERAELYFE